MPSVESGVERGTANPSVSEREIPITDEGVFLLQKTPKSSPSPFSPTVESAFLAL